jgi:hypothetical protein
MSIRIIPYKEYLNKFIDELANDGERAIKEAYATREFRNRSFNLKDSYGSAVYVDGKLIKRTIRYLGPEDATNALSVGWIWDKPRSLPDFRGARRLTGDEIQMTGREEVMDFFSHYVPSGKGIELVIVAAMWYANVLEKGGANLRRKWRVISGAATFMYSLQRKYGGFIEPINTYRDLSIPTTIKDTSWKQK